MAGIYGEQWVEQLIAGLRQEIKNLKQEIERLKEEIKALNTSTRNEPDLSEPKHFL